MNTTTISIKDTFRESWRLTKKHIWILTAVFTASLILYLLIEILTGNINRFSYDPNANGGLTPMEALQQAYSLKALAAWLLSSLTFTFFSLGLSRMSLQVADGAEPGLGDFVTSPKKILHCFLAQLIYNIVVLIGFFLCILPGLLLMTRLQFYVYFIVEEDCNAIEALSKTWEYTKGNTWKIFGFTLLCIAVLFASLLLLVVGFFFAIPAVYVACALIYRKLKEAVAPKVGFESL